MREIINTPRTYQSAFVEIASLHVTCCGPPEYVRKVSNDRYLGKETPSISGASVVACFRSTAERKRLDRKAEGRDTELYGDRTVGFFRKILPSSSHIFLQRALGFVAGLRAMRNVVFEFVDTSFRYDRARGSQLLTCNRHRVTRNG